MDTEGTSLFVAPQQKRNGESAALACWESPSTIRWVDRLEFTSIGPSWIVTLNDWRSHDDGNDGFAVSGVVTTDEDQFCWQFMHFTEIK